MKKRLLLCTLFVVLSMSFSIAQTLDEANKSFLDGNYKVALQSYLSLYHADSLNPETNYRIGQCYLKLNTDRTQAIPYLEYASSHNKRLEPEVFYYLAIAHFHAHHFPLTTLTLNYYLSLKKIKFEKEAEHLKETCMNAEDLTEDPVDVEFIHLGKNINTEACEYNPYTSTDEDILVFSSCEDNACQVCMSTKGWFSDEWAKAKSISGRLKSVYDVEVGGLSNDGKTLFVHHSKNSPVQDIDMSKRNWGKFQELTSVGETVNTTDYREEGCTLSKWGDTLFFASDRAGGFGGFDIYMCLKLPNGKWGLPINLGQSVNTAYDENYPIYNDSLIFCSKGHNSMGGYDLFSSRYNPETDQWSDAQNLGFPINNTYDNTTLCMVNNQYGYMSANRMDSYGDLDIYKVILNRKDIIRLVYKGNILVGDTVSSVPVHLVDTEISITVRNKETGEIYGTYSYRRDNSSYVISLLPGIYELSIEGSAYNIYKEDLNIPHSALSEENNVVLKNFYLTKKEKGTVIPQIK